MATTTASAPNIDRTQTTPFLLKVFYRVNNFHRLEDFRASSQPGSFVEVYTWKDCTLVELSTLLLSALPSLASTATKCSFRLIYADPRLGRFTSQELGSVPVPPPSKGSTPTEPKSSSEESSSKSLGGCRFVVGDWIDVSIATSSPSGPSGGGGGGGGSGGGIGAAMRGAGGGRENGLRVRGLGSGRHQGAGASVPSGDWRRGEKVEDDSGRNGGGGSGGGGGGRSYGGGGRRGSRW